MLCPRLLGLRHRARTYKLQTIFLSISYYVLLPIIAYVYIHDCHAIKSHSEVFVSRNILHLITDCCAYQSKFMQYQEYLFLTSKLT